MVHVAVELLLFLGNENVKKKKNVRLSVSNPTVLMSIYQTIKKVCWNCDKLGFVYFILFFKFH